MDFAYAKMGFVGGYILSAGFLPLVAVGLHQALTPIHAMLNDPSGPTNGINYLLPILMMAGGGQVGAGLALYMKTKNQKLKRFIRDSIPVGILGVGEPLMYAVTLPLGKAFITACLGAGFGGIVASLCHVGTVSQGVSGLFGLLIVEPGHQLQYVLAMLCAYLGGFVLTWFFGVDENRINDIYGEN
jgi:PTS system sucrose-specific IIC component